MTGSAGAGAQGLVVAGYQLVANSFGGYTVLGNCSYHVVYSGSGRDARSSTVYYNQTCSWDLYGNLLSVTPGAPVVPAPLSVNGTQTVYAANAQGVFTGSDSALPLRGFVFTPGSHFSWLTPNPYTVLSQTIYTVTATLKSDGDMPLSISSVQASALQGIVTINSNTCAGQIPVGSTCAVSVTYDPTRLRSATGLRHAGHQRDLGRWTSPRLHAALYDRSKPEQRRLRRARTEPRLGRVISKPAHCLGHPGTCSTCRDLAV